MSGIAPRPFLTGRLVYGLVVLALGVLWTLDNFGVVDASRILAWWPAAALAWGAMLLTGVGVARCRTPGLIWLLVGTIAGLHNLGVWRLSLVDLFPLFLVGLGALIVARAWRGTRPESAGPVGDDSGRVNYFHLLSAAERRVRSQAFVGGEASAILSGLTVDLRAARVANGRAVLDVFAMWGGIEILAPAGWRVVSRVTPVLGAVVDSMPAVTDPAAPVLELRGIAVMGGVDVRPDDRTRRKIRRAIVGVHIAPGVHAGVSRHVGRRDDGPDDEVGR